jgi:hypothetical protein
MLTCPVCRSGELELVERLADDRRTVRCTSCDHQWTRGEAKTSTPLPSSSADLQARFPDRTSVDPTRLERVQKLAAEAPPSDPAHDWSHFQHVFSRDEITGCSAADLRAFVNETPGATNATTASFNRAWASMGEHEASARTRNTIRYLLYGPETVPLPDRLTRLILGQGGLGMTGFKEPALTRVLVAMFPETYLPVWTYGAARGGKREIAKRVYGLTLPDVAKEQLTIGRLALWSNELLVDLVRDDFDDLSQAAAFLTTVKVPA